MSDDEKQETVLVLRVCRPDMTSQANPNIPGAEVFRWPASGPVEAPDWEPTAKCGWGLHGWLWGSGDVSMSDYWKDVGAKWLVVEVLKTDIIDLKTKVKFPRGNVIFCGDRVDAVKIIATRAPTGTSIMFGSATAGDYGSATAGYKGSATAGDYGSATAGYKGSATAGDRGSATAGDYGSATAGYSGSATAGNGGSATAGNGGSATAGYSGSATAGDYGSATAGYKGSATAGDGGSISVQWYDERLHCYRRAVAEIDKEGEFKPGVVYVVDANGRIVRKP